MSVRLLPLLLALGLAAGCRETLPSLLLHVEDPEQLAPTQLRVTVQGEGLEPATVTRPEQPGAALSGPQTLRVLLPESAAGRTARLTVEALKAGEPVGLGEVEARVARGQETRVSVAVRAVASCPEGGCVCDAETCPEGCCQEGRCVSPSREACGSAGSACGACSGDTVDRCTGGACRCGADLPCGEDYRCEEGACVPKGEGPACSDASECTAPPGQCFEAQGTCTPEGTCHYAPKGEGTGCDDGDACTGADACDGQGRCVGQATACTTPPGQCHEASGACMGGACEYAARQQGSPCNDGDACTSSDACNGAGACAGTAITCNTPPGQCHQPSGTCSDGSCSYLPKSQGATCNDGNACTTNDACNGTGTCAGTAIACNTPPSQCHQPSGTCSDGSCSYAFKGQGATCDDGNPCTDNDVCNGAGGCAGTPRVCNSPPGSCYQATGTCSGGTCSYAPKAAGAACGAGTTDCRTEACNGSGACVATNQPNGTSCGNGCYSCSGGTCSQYDCTGTQLCCPWTDGNACVSAPGGQCPDIP